MIAPANDRPGWQGRLTLRYTHSPDRAATTGHDVHEGPLRVLKALYPEGPGICHHVLVHPPGGVVGGDVLKVDVHLASGAHTLITTPGATRFYRSTGALAQQRCELTLQAGARLEWLPLEAIAYPGCIADNEVLLQLHGDAQMIGWDVIALGLPAAGAAFDTGVFTQRLAWPGHWLEQGHIDARDALLRHSKLGLAGQPVLATMWLASGTPLTTAQTEALLEAARALCANDETLMAGSTAPHSRLVLLRVLAPQVEGALRLLKAVRAAWRAQAWGLPPNEPRVWKN
jgi:urease accessory protein